MNADEAAVMAATARSDKGERVRNIRARMREAIISHSAYESALHEHGKALEYARISIQDSARRGETSALYHVYSPTRGRIELKHHARVAGLTDGVTSALQAEGFIVVTAPIDTDIGFLVDREGGLNWFRALEYVLSISW